MTIRLFDKENFINGEWKYTLIVWTIIFLIPFGAFMGFYTDNPAWFLLCALIVFFLS